MKKDIEIDSEIDSLITLKTQMEDCHKLIMTEILQKNAIHMAKGIPNRKYLVSRTESKD